MSEITSAASAKKLSRRLHFSELSQTQQWNIVLIAILLIEAVMIWIFIPNMIAPRQLLDTTTNFIEVAIIALGMAFVIISKNIDISVGSTLALVSVVIAVCFQAGLPQGFIIVLALATGALLGLVNGTISTKLKIPALVVTLGTYSLYRGIAYVVLGDQTYHEYPGSFLTVGSGHIGGVVPIPFVAFACLVALAAFLLHRTTFGRKIYAIGNNAKAVRYSGVRVDENVIAVFAMTGLLTAVASIIMTARNASTRGNMASGIELDTIAAVVLGGVGIEGGRGSILGVVVSVFVLGFLRNGMYALNVSPELMKIAIGGLLIVSLLFPKLFRAGREEKNVEQDSAEV